MTPHSALPLAIAAALAAVGLTAIGQTWLALPAWIAAVLGAFRVYTSRHVAILDERCSTHDDTGEHRPNR